MDLSQLPTLGKVAGVAGVALGVAALLAGAAVEKLGVLPSPWNGVVAVVVAAGGVLIGVVTVLGAVRGAAGDAQSGKTRGDLSPVDNINRSKSKANVRQEGSTRGDGSPVRNIRE